VPYYAGLDWSGTPHWRQASKDPVHYIACGVRLESIEDLTSKLSAWRTEMGRPAEFEFHGYKSDPSLVARMLEYATAHATVVAFVFDKPALAADLGDSVFDKPVLLPFTTGQIVIQKMLETGPLRKLWCDKGDVASNRHGQFNTSLMRVARSLWNEGLSVAHIPSDKSPMIQLTDMVAYALHREVQGLWRSEEVKRHVRKLWKNDGNLIRWGNGDDLRPYL
jgi:hypothetical protein